MSKREAITRLRTCLADLFDTRHRGTAAERYAKSQGFVDGYMQALADMQIVDDRELLTLVGEERRRAGERAETQLPSLPPRPSVPNFA
jgi:hypothetical protein